MDRETESAVESALDEFLGPKPAGGLLAAFREAMRPMVGLAVVNLKNDQDFMSVVGALSSVYAYIEKKAPGLEQELGAYMERRRAATAKISQAEIDDQARMKAQARIIEDVLENPFSPRHAGHAQAAIAAATSAELEDLHAVEGEAGPAPDPLIERATRLLGG